ncbi:MAG TPA: hypothetical protein O0X32_01075 [Methanocorpusculum sp.]|nr:hypothetical protein [Methanocorpusculum sp.]
MNRFTKIIGVLLAVLLVTAGFAGAVSDVKYTEWDLTQCIKEITYYENECEIATKEAEAVFEEMQTSFYEYQIAYRLDPDYNAKREKFLDRADIYDKWSLKVIELCEKLDELYEQKEKIEKYFNKKEKPENNEYSLLNLFKKAFGFNYYW